ncbi:MAG: M55 family metallopeptidase [Steroidobacteraceae bacterium]
MRAPRNLRWLTLLAAGAILAAAASPAPSSNLKIYISVDMEGVAGVVTADQLLPGGFEYERFRRFMTDETLAAVRAAKQAGAAEIVVSDSHGNGENLLIEAFPKDVHIVRSWPRHGAMMAGLDQSFAAAVFIGYHASTTNMQGVRAHTFSSAHLTRVALNGGAVTEGEFNAAYAGDFGVPIIFASGDDAAIAEIKAHLGDLDTVITKTTLGFHSAESLTPAASCDLIFAGVLHAVAHRAQRHAYVVAKPVTLELSFKNYMPAEVLGYLRSVERVDSHTIRFVGKDMQEVTDFVDVVERYNPDLAP